MAKRASLEWDDEKNSENQNKHGVSFAQAQYVFADRNRVILKDHAPNPDKPEPKKLKRTQRRRDAKLPQSFFLLLFFAQPLRLCVFA
jgi:uncharacterized DUF497 family protein